MNVELDYNIGEIIYLITDRERNPYIITEIKITPNDVMYLVSGMPGNMWVYSIEITRNSISIN